MILNEFTPVFLSVLFKSYDTPRKGDQKLFLVVSALATCFQSKAGQKTKQKYLCPNEAVLLDVYFPNGGCVVCSLSWFSVPPPPLLSRSRLSEENPRGIIYG